jgi:hypothetical protein
MNVPNNPTRLYDKRGYGRFYVGQAQKWLNMTLKYIYVMGDERVPSYDRFYGFGHVPIDNVIIGRFQEYKPRRLGAWSRLNDYEEYLGYQQWIRETWPDSAPFAVEFNLWQTE